MKKMDKLDKNAKERHKQEMSAVADIFMAAKEKASRPRDSIHSDKSTAPMVPELPRPRKKKAKTPIVPQLHVHIDPFCRLD